MVKAEGWLEYARPERSKIERSEKVKAVEKRLSAERHCADLWMDYGLALSEQFLYREATEAYSMAIAHDPFKGIYYRHRGHRYISCREYEKAAADFVTATRMIPENWDSWYHLGLAYFLMGDFASAETAYRRCYELNSDVSQFCACTDWYWRTLMRLGKTEEAWQLIDKVDSKMDPDADETGYSRTVLIYKGVLSAEEQMQALTNDGPLSTPTIAYAISNYYAMRGEMEQSNAALDYLLSFCTDNWWSAFGYLAGLNDKAARA